MKKNIFSSKVQRTHSEKQIPIFCCIPLNTFNFKIILVKASKSMQQYIFLSESKGLIPKHKVSFFAAYF